jgi:hypothetical protein
MREINCFRLGYSWPTRGENKAGDCVRVREYMCVCAGDDLDDAGAVLDACSCLCVRVSSCY